MYVLHILRREKPVDSDDGEQKATKKNAQSYSQRDRHEHTWINTTDVYYKIVP